MSWIECSGNWVPIVLELGPQLGLDSRSLNKLVTKLLSGMSHVCPHDCFTRCSQSQHNPVEVIKESCGSLSEQSSQVKNVGCRGEGGSPWEALFRHWKFFVPISKQGFQLLNKEKLVRGLHQASQTFPHPSKASHTLYLTVLTLFLDFSSLSSPGIGWKCCQLKDCHSH